MRIIIGFAAACGIAMAGSTAHAQYDFGPPVDYQALNFEFTQQWAADSFDDEDDEADYSPRSFARDDADDARFVPSQADPAAFDFKRNKRLRREITNDVVEAVRQESPSGAVELARTDVFGLVGGAMRSYGLSTNNLADAMTLYASEIFQSGRRTEVEMTRAQALNIRRQMAAALGDGQRSREELQRQSDRMILQAFLIYSERTNCLANPQSDCDAYWGAVDEQAVAIFGVPANQVTMTEEGFAFGEDARRADMDAGPERLASDAPAPIDGAGECGFPIRSDGDRQVQALMAKFGQCDTYVGPRK